jgi:hypothetical protein
MHHTPTRPSTHPSHDLTSRPSPDRTSRRRPVRALVVVAALVAAILVPALASPARAGDATVPPIPSGLPTAIEGLSPYVPNTGCDLRNRTGTLKLGNLIKATYANSYSTLRSCTGATRPNSEHFDGRALDTFFNVRDTAERADAGALLTWLLVTDDSGNRFANARRLGVMYIIWNNKMWSSYRTDEGWRPYLNCAQTPEPSADTNCHRNHIHLTLSWEGALGRTSFWTKQVAAVDWGPCRPSDLNWSAGYSSANVRRCPAYSTVTAPAGASSLLKELVPRSGMVLRYGMTGAAVSSLQKAIGVSPTGSFLSTTSARLKAWQLAHGLVASGIAYHSTWRALLKANGMR